MLLKHEDRAIATIRDSAVVVASEALDELELPEDWYHFSRESTGSRSASRLGGLGSLGEEGMNSTSSRAPSVHSTKRTVPMILTELRSMG